MVIFAPNTFPFFGRELNSKFEIHNLMWNSKVKFRNYRTEAEDPGRFCRLAPENFLSKFNRHCESLNYGPRTADRCLLRLAIFFAKLSYSPFYLRNCHTRFALSDAKENNRLGCS